MPRQEFEAARHQSDPETVCLFVILDFRFVQRCDRTSST